jgi:hypothetical protein
MGSQRKSSLSVLKNWNFVVTTDMQIFLKSSPIIHVIRCQNVNNYPFFMYQETVVTQNFENEYVP